MARRRNRGGVLHAAAEINVTALVDVALTLLVIFMITTPMLQGGVEVSIPRAETQSVPAADGVIVSVDRDGQIFIGDAPAAWDEFRTAFPDAVRQSRADNVYLRADEAVPYGRVVQVLGAMKAADVAKVGLIAEPEAAGR